MDIRVSGHQIETGEALRVHAEERLSTVVGKYFSRAISSVVGGLASASAMTERTSCKAPRQSLSSGVTAT